MSKASELLVVLESNWRDYHYHATPHDFEPENIRPGSHTGTIKAAKQILPGRKNLSIHAYHYQSPNKSIEIPDIMPGGTVTGDLKAVADHFHKTGVISSEEHESVHQHPVYGRFFNHEHFSNLMRSKGIGS